MKQGQLLCRVRLWDSDGNRVQNWGSSLGWVEREGQGKLLGSTSRTRHWRQSALFSKKDLAFKAFFQINTTQLEFWELWESTWSNVVIPLVYQTLGQSVTKLIGGSEAALSLMPNVPSIKNMSRTTFANPFCKMVFWGPIRDHTWKRNGKFSKESSQWWENKWVMAKEAFARAANGFVGLSLSPPLQVNDTSSSSSIWQWRKTWCHRKPTPAASFNNHRRLCPKRTHRQWIYQAQNTSSSTGLFDPESRCGHHVMNKSRWTRNLEAEKKKISFNMQWV